MVVEEKLRNEELYDVYYVIQIMSNPEERLSKYLACSYLNVSRATFDNYVRCGKLPKGKKTAGFKELSWTKKDLDEAVAKIKRRGTLLH